MNLSKNHVLIKIIIGFLCTISGISFATCRSIELSRGDVSNWIATVIQCSIYAETGAVSKSLFPYTYTLTLTGTHFFDYVSKVSVNSKEDNANARSSSLMDVSLTRNSRSEPDDFIIRADVAFVNSSGSETGIMFKDVLFHIPRYVIRDNLSIYETGSFYFKYNRDISKDPDQATFEAFSTANNYNSGSVFRPDMQIVKIQCPNDSTFYARIDHNYISNVTVQNCLSTIIGPAH